MLAHPTSFLIIDEDSTFIESTVEHLKPLNYIHTFTANSSALALDILLKEKIDLVFIDDNISEMSCLELCHQYKNQKTQQHESAFILCSDTQDNMLPAQALKEGFYDYLPKSKLNPISLKRTIENALEKSKLANELIKSEKEREVLIEKLQTSNMQMKKLVGIAAHDLRNPLHNINLSAEFIKESPLNEDQLECLELIENSGELAYSLVNDLLDLTALETGEIQLEKENFSLAEACREVLDELDHLAKRKNITLKLNIDSSIIAHADQKRICQVINNLISNAIKFSAEGLSIDLTSTTSNTNVSLHVTDHGVGIEESVIAQLFNKLERTFSTGTNGEQGTGFGLPLAQELIKAHGKDHKISVQSKVGEGSTFSFTLDPENK